MLGERLLLDLHHRLGSHDFTEAIRRLHSQAKLNQPPSPETALGAEQLHRAFQRLPPAAAVIDRWMDGIPPYDTSRIDSSSADGRIQKIDGNFLSLHLSLEANGPPVSSIPYDHQGDTAWISLTHDQRVIRTTNLRIQYNTYFEDGHLAWSNHVEQAVNPEHNHAISLQAVSATDPNLPLTAGNYWTFVSEGQRKIAHLQWSIDR